MNKSFLSLMAILLIPISVQSQEKVFPFALKPGDTFVAPATNDTLFWVLDSGQFNKILVNVELISALENKVDKLEQLIVLKKSTIASLRSGYEKYRATLVTTDYELGVAENNYNNQKRRNRGWKYGAIGAGLAFALTLTISVSH